jgi:AcrR family transcriptional regulator
MARARSPEKRHSILRAAVREIAQVDLGASAAKIEKGANLAEGALPTYFAPKDELPNDLYVGLKGEAYRRINANFPHEAELREHARHERGSIASGGKSTRLRGHQTTRQISGACVVCTGNASPLRVKVGTLNSAE